MKGKWLLLAPLVSIVGFAVEARAQDAPWRGFYNQCSLGSIRTCASFEVNAIRYGTGTSARTQVYIRVRNLFAILSDGARGGSTLSRLAVINPNLVDAKAENVLSAALGGIGGGQTIFLESPGFASSGNPASYWGSFGNLNSLTDPNGDGKTAPGGVEWGLSTKTPSGGINDCTGPDGLQLAYFRTCGTGGVPDGWIVFAFTTQTDVQLNDVQLAWGAVSVSASGTGSGDLGSFQGESCVGGCGTEVVPEPVTMVLLGSGLVGIGGMRLRRRRKEEEG